MNKYSVLCTICARGGSKGVKNKNIRLLNNKPLIAYTVEIAKETGLFNHIVISSDSDQIIQTAKDYGAEAFFKRPEELSTDNMGKIPVIRHTLLESEKFYNKKFEYIIDLDATSPLRNKDDVIGSFNMLIDNDFDNVITATNARRSPYFNLVEIDGNKVVLSKKLNNSIVRRQDSPKCFDMNASIYVWKREILIKCDNLFLDNTGLFIMPESRSLDIDSELDFEIVEYLMKQRKKKC